MTKLKDWFNQPYFLIQRKEAYKDHIAIVYGIGMRCNECNNPMVIGLELQLEGNN